MGRRLFLRRQDLRAWQFAALVLVLLAAKLLLASAQRLYLSPEDAALDDMLMYNAAVSISEGQWLGPYGSLTLSKYGFFSLWLAGLHALGVPYLLGGQLLWAAASLVAALALAPLLKTRLYGLLVYAALLFCPSSTANPAPYGFVLRVYRDNIFPTLCLLCVACMLGFVLRWLRPLGRAVGWAFAAGVFLACAWLCREDGWWLALFMGLAGLVYLWLVFSRKEEPLTRKLGRAAALLLPGVLLAVGILGWSAANHAHYGRFILSDFYTGEFADAYGAMTRVRHSEWNPLVDVPREVRLQLYERVPAFARLQPALESKNYQDRYMIPSGAGEEFDYTSGSFYWALREAAAAQGYYDDPETARAYFEQLAREVNALCDAGVLDAGPRRSSVSPPIKGAYVWPVMKEGLYSLWHCATFQDCDPRPLFVPGGNDPTYYAEKIQPMEQFLHGKAQTATEAGSADPYFTPAQNIGFAALDLVRWAYACLTPLAFLAALVWQVWALAAWLKGRPWKGGPRAPFPGSQGMLWAVCALLLFCVLLRAAMVAFASVSSFTIGTYVMYLASIHPLLLLYALLGSMGLAGLVVRTKAAKTRSH